MESPGKKVLIVTYYWPPSAGSGVQRWLKLTKYLPEFGVQPYVLTPSNPYFPLKDESLLEDVHPDVQVIHKPIREPYRILEWIEGSKIDNTGSKTGENGGGIFSYIKRLIRGNVFIPDPRVTWVAPMTRFLTDYLEEENIETLITTGPPHSMHMIGRNVQRRNPAIRWIADFRDPFTALDFYRDLPIIPWIRRRYKQIERSIVEEAEIVVGTSPSMVDFLTHIDRDKYKTITNGYDEEDFEGFSKVEKQNGTPFRILHAGLLNPYRNPLPLWEALEQMLSQGHFRGNEVIVELAGTVDDKVMKKLKDYPKLLEVTHLLGYLSHEEVIKRYYQSDLLLLLVNNNPAGRAILPGKIFELMAVGKPILNFSPEGSDAWNIISELHSSKNFSYNASSDEIIDWINRIRRGGFQPNSERDIQKYSRKNTAEEFAELL